MSRRLITTLALAALPLVARSHGGADGGAHHALEVALGHPLAEGEHLFAMLAVGLLVALAAWWVVSALRRSRRGAERRSQRR